MANSHRCYVSNNTLILGHPACMARFHWTTRVPYKRAPLYIIALSGDDLWRNAFSQHLTKSNESTHYEYFTVSSIPSCLKSLTSCVISCGMVSCCVISCGVI